MSSPDEADRELTAALSICSPVGASSDGAKWQELIKLAFCDPRVIAAIQEAAQDVKHWDEEAAVPPPSEVDRRLDAVLSMWPFLRNEPPAQRWHIVAAWLVKDPEVWKVIERRTKARRPGARRKSADKLKFTLNDRADIARRFKQFEVGRRKAGSRLSKLEMVGKFRTAERKRDAASAKKLPRNADALDRIIRQGARALKYPRVVVNGREHIAHPIQAEAIAAIRKYPLDSDEERRAQIADIMSLDPDRPCDLDRMASLRTIYMLRVLTVRTLFAPPGKETSGK